MRVVLDTNVIVSGIFFGGTPNKILIAWRRGVFKLIASQAILEEYQAVIKLLAKKYQIDNVNHIVDLITIHAEIIAVPVVKSVCADSDDDKFFACAFAAQVPIIVSGDKHLLDVDNYMGIQVLKPKAFYDNYC